MLLPAAPAVGLAKQLGSMDPLKSKFSTSNSGRHQSMTPSALFKTLT